MSRLHPFRRNTEFMVGQSHRTVEKARGRLTFIWMFFLLLFIVVGVRAADVSLMSLVHEKQDQVQNSIPLKEIAARRGDIVDRNGVLLATSLRTASLYADPALIDSSRKVAQDLSRVLPDLSYDELVEKFKATGRFVWVKRNLTPDQHYAINALGYPGLAFEYEEKRIYPQGAEVAHMVGYTNVDGYGLAGVEAKQNKTLGQGKDLKLTLDVRVQHILADELSKIKTTFKAKSATGLVMDVRSGEVLAAVSMPSFDPHKAGEESKNALFNRVTLGVYEMGSTFKIFSTAAQLEFVNDRLAQWFDARKSLKRGRFTIADYHAEKRQLSVPEVFIHSSNIGAALMGEAVGTQRLKDFYADLGLTSAAKFDVAEIGAPIVPKPWRDINTLTAAYGHGIAVSPLQLGTAVSAMVNGGTLVRPTLVRSDDKEKQPEVRVISTETSEKMRQLLRLTVSHGTGKNADVVGYMVGGKTGTAEKATKSGYDRKRLMSSFIGAFPMDDPQYLVLTIFDEPQGHKGSYGYATGGWTGAPSVGGVIARAAPLLGIAPREENAASDIALPIVNLLHAEKMRAASY